MSVDIEMSGSTFLHRCGCPIDRTVLQLALQWSKLYPRQDILSTIDMHYITKK